MTGVGQALESLATTAASVDELVQEAELWLFGRHRLLPADRVLRDLARKAFASIEVAALEAINSEIPAHKQAKVLAAVHSSRRGRVGGTVLEWLKVPAGKHSPTSITEVTDKISYLKELGVDTWEGRAYVGVVPFTMKDVSPWWSPSVPGISNFHELNVRTYVHDAQGNPGVWFYSLDCNQPLAVQLARRLFSLPYVNARQSGTRPTRENARAAPGQCPRQPGQCWSGKRAPGRPLASPANCCGPGNCARRPNGCCRRAPDRRN